MNLTLVTAFYDLSRENWNFRPRNKTDYYKYIERTFKFDNNLIIFCSIQDREKFLEFRKGKEDKTHIIISEFKDLTMYKHISQIKKCQENKKLINKHPCPFAPELCYPEYCVLMNSRIDLVAQAIKINPFNTTHFAWIDAGYVRDKDDYRPPNMPPMYDSIYPEILMKKTSEKNTVIFSILRPLQQMKKTRKEFFLQYIDIISGGFFIGTLESITKFATIYKQFYEDVLYNDEISDDDQYYLALLYRERPELFSHVYAQWFNIINFR